MLHNIAVKATLSGAAVLSALLIPAAGSASAASPGSGKTVTVRADSYDARCRSHNRNYVLKKYYRQVPVGPPSFITLRCGTSTWGWKHIKARHGWNSTMDRKISAAIGFGAPNGRGGYSTYTNQCPGGRVEKFRTIIGTPAGGGDLLTAYNVDQRVAAAAPC
ncbi:hypothetical protein ACIGXF_38520 [Streptomyces sp. NPDC053086]|uniref:hypothetical protein n=1 Tax=unclassified Streptomyces TaxID=2593676 RepID=UPI0037CD6987